MENISLELSVIKTVVGQLSSSPAEGSQPSQSSCRRVLEPPTFIGTRNAKKLENFIWDVEQYFQTAVCCLSYWRRKIIVAGTSSALSEAGLHSMTWDDLKVEPRNQFLPSNSSYAAMDSLLRPRHTGSVREYVKAYAALMLEIDDMSDHDKLYYFLASL